jgi:hypothetical protein
MSAIDAYKHKHLGFIECPSTYDFVDYSETRKIAIYKLFDNIPDNEECFDGKIGDILVGGGSGEAPALRISNPIAFQFFTANEDAFTSFKYDHLSDVLKAFWTPTKSFILGEGFLKLGWTPDTSLEMWLTENVCKLLISTVDEFSLYKGEDIDLSTNLTLINSSW